MDAMHTCPTPLDTLAADLARRIESRDTVTATLDNGDVVTLTCPFDDAASLLHFDYYGRAAFESQPRRCDGFRQRPAGFDGNAQVLERSYHGRLWWQPPADVARGTAQFTALERHVRGWFTHQWHYCGLVVTVRGDRRSLDREASVWGIQSNSDRNDLADVIRDLLEECNVTLAECVGAEAT